MTVENVKGKMYQGVSNMFRARYIVPFVLGGLTVATILGAQKPVMREYEQKYGQIKANPNVPNIPKP
jgi:hypothetical protein